MNELNLESISERAVPWDQAKIPAERLNSSCFCSSLDREALKSALSSELGEDDLYALVEERCPYLFSARPVFISESRVRKIVHVVAAIESVIRLPAYREIVLASAPEVAKKDVHGAQGVFLGYDFHPAGDNLGLIEINTNAGGAMLNAALARAHRTCCMDDEQLGAAVASGAVFENAIVQMFQTEWSSSNRRQPLRTIAIVDLTPREQYLYPEFLLFQRLFTERGIDAVIAAPSELVFRDGALWFDETRIDLVYNRLTDFMLEETYSEAIRDAYFDDAVVVTPHPQTHALYANKRNLSLLCGATALRGKRPAHPPSIANWGWPYSSFQNGDLEWRMQNERRCGKGA